MGILVFLLLTAMIIVPIIFKPQLVKLIKEEANKNINATVDFESIHLNLFENFPNLSLNINNLTLINKPPFAGDTLAYISSFKSTLDLISLIKDKTVRIVSIAVNEPHIHLTALKDGTVNWNIFKIPEEQQAEPVTKAESNYSLTLQKYEIIDGTILYNDQSSGMQVIADHLDHTGNGDFTQDQFQLATLTKIHDLSAGFGGINYLSNVEMQLKADIDVNVKDKKFALKKNELQLNQLVLSFDGYVMMLEKEMVIDLKFISNQSDLKNILSLIPVFYNKYLADIKTAGKAALEGYIEGTYKEDHYPLFHVQLAINDGMFQYPQSPSEVNHINFDLVLDNPGGLLDNTLIDLKECYAEINKEPFNATLQIKTPISNPYISASVKGMLNLHDIKNLTPLEEDADLSGSVTSDLFIEGTLANIEKNQYDKYQARGNLSFKEIIYNGPAMPVKVRVPHANLEFKPEKVSLNSFQVLMGNSDISASGSLDHVLPYLLNSQNLTGHLTVNSTFFDLNPWFESPSMKLSAIELPAGIDFAVNSSFKEVSVGKLKISNISGILALKDKILHLIELNMDLLNGSMTANGTYSKVKDTPAHSFFDLKISHLSIAEVFQNFLTVQKFVPFAKSIQGNFAANMEIVTDFDSTLTPVFSTVTSSGSLIIQKMLVENLKPLDILADILKMEKLRKLTIENIQPSFTVQEGRFNLAPVNFKIDNTDVVLAGSNSIDMTIDYLMKLIIPAKELNNQTNNIINKIFNKKLDILQEDHVVLDVSFKGTIDKPAVNVSGRDILKGVGVKLIDIAKQEILKQEVFLPDTVTIEIDKQKSQLEQLKKEAEKQLKGLFKTK